MKILHIFISTVTLENRLIFPFIMFPEAATGGAL